MQPNQRVRSLAPSATLALDARAKELAAAGRDVLNLAVGEPDFGAPAAARAAAVEKVESGRVHYTPAAGTASLRRAVAEHLSATRGVPFTPAEVTICHSAKHALSGAALTLVEPGDEVLLLLPAWVSYVEILRFAGARPVEVAPREDLGPDLSAIAAAIGPRTRGIVLNSPSNPSGYVMTEEEVRGIVALAERHDLWLISDEIYRRLVYEGAPFFSPVQVSPAARARTVIVDGASKAYAMTGYRIGFCAAPREIARAVGDLHSQLTGCPNGVSQAAYEACLESEPAEVAQMAREFDARRRAILQGLADLGLPTPRPRGAFYAFPDVSSWLDERGSAGFCEDLLEQHDLAIVPGSAFGMEGHVRLSYATSMATIERALERLAAFLAKRTPRASPARAR